MDPTVTRVDVAYTPASPVAEATTELETPVATPGGGGGTATSVDLHMVYTDHIHVRNDALTAAKLARALEVTSRRGEALGLRLAPGQRIGVAVVQLANPVPVEALFADLQIGARERL